MIIVIWSIIGLVLCVIAYLIHNKKMYGLVSGYNTSSPEDKLEYEQNGYLQFTGRLMWVTAITWLLGIPIIILDVPYGLEIHIVLFTIVVMYGTLKGLKFSPIKKRKRNTMIQTIVMVVTVVAVIVLFWLGSKPTNLSIKDGNIHLEGMYGYEFSSDEIIELKMINELPTDLLRTNGFGTSTRLLGYFSSKELGGKGRMYVYTSNESYIYMNTKNGFVIINSKDVNETDTWYNKINRALTSQRQSE